MVLHQESTKVEIDGSPEPYIKARELAKMLSIKEGTIQDWYRRYPDFPCIKLPGSIRVRASEVRAWLDKFTRAGKEES
jgi:predicted DNA-binding transcriptional regulator AlpA